MSTTKERMKSGEAFVGMKRRGSQLFLLINVYIFFFLDETGRGKYLLRQNMAE